jgi:hypothetical protein
MGAIKDIVDLTKDLEARAKDRRDMETIHKIQSLAFTLQSQQADIVERDVRLMEENAQLKRELAESQAEEIRVWRTVEFRRSARTDGHWRAFCPKCHLPAAIPRGGPVLCSDSECRWEPDVGPTEVESYIRQLSTANA